MQFSTPHNFTNKSFHKRNSNTNITSKIYILIQLIQVRRSHKVLKIILAAYNKFLFMANRPFFSVAEKVIEKERVANPRSNFPCICENLSSKILILYETAIAIKPIDC